MLPDNSLNNKQAPSEKALISSSLNLFIIHHEKKITVTQLIRSAGVSKAVFYKHFANKDDIFAAILLADEMKLTPILKELRLFGNVSSLLEEYLRFRIQHIERYRVLSRLESYLSSKDSDLPRFKQWQILRRQHVDEFSAIIESRISRLKPIDKENVRFYYGLVWAIATGVAQLSETDFFHELILDRRGFTKFLLESISSIGDVR